MKKYELKMLLEASKAENEILEEKFEELNNNLCKMRINKDRHIQELQNRIKELETTIRVIQNL